MQLRKATYSLACINDEFRPIAGYEGTYEVNRRGLIRNAQTKHNLKAGLGGVGYFTVALNHKTHSVHRLVAAAFCDNTNNKPYVNHIDGNKQNNHYVNLEWCTPSENEKHAHSIGLKKSSKDKMPVCQYDASGNLVREYTSMTEAETFGFSSGNIARSCKRGIKHKGYYFKYKN